MKFKTSLIFAVLLSSCSAHINKSRILYQNSKSITILQDKDKDGQYEAKLNIQYTISKITKLKDLNNDGIFDAKVTVYTLARSKSGSVLEELIEIDENNDNKIDYEFRLKYDERGCIIEQEFNKYVNNKKLPAKESESVKMMDIINSFQ